MDIFRIKAWTHYERKRAKGEPKEGIISAGFKAPPGTHAIMLHVGNVAEGLEVTEEMVIEQLRQYGFERMPE